MRDSAPALWALIECKPSEQRTQTGVLGGSYFILGFIYALWTGLCSIYSAVYGQQCAFEPLQRGSILHGEHDLVIITILLLLSVSL